MELSQNFPHHLKEILNAMIAHWGEERVDIIDRSGSRSAEVVVWYPEVTVTNERGNHIDIKDLYADITISYTGEFYNMQMIKATYSQAQWNVGYAHSHLPRVGGNLPEWREPCYGHGPILRTMDVLKRSDTSIPRWMLFMSDLDDYVTVESLNGGPYYRLGEVPTGNIHVGSPISDFSSAYLSNRVTSHLKGLLTRGITNVYIPKLAFDGYRYRLGETPMNYIIGLSKALDDAGIEYPKEHYVIKDDRLYDVLNSSRYSNKRYDPEAVVLTFKGNPIKLRITDSDENLNTGGLQVVNLIEYSIALHYLSFITANVAVPLGTALTGDSIYLA